MWTLNIITVVVVVVDDDTYYWVYLSSNHLFQVYYKVRQVLLQSATAFFITKCDGLLLQSATAFLLQSATAFLLQSVTSVITKCDRYYKVWQFYYKVRQVLQSVTILLQSATGITKCDEYYKVRQYMVTAAKKRAFESCLACQHFISDWLGKLKPNKLSTGCQNELKGVAVEKATSPGRRLFFSNVYHFHMVEICQHFWNVFWRLSKIISW